MVRAIKAEDVYGGGSDGEFEEDMTDFQDADRTRWVVRHTRVVKGSQQQERMSKRLDYTIEDRDDVMFDDSAEDDGPRTDHEGERDEEEDGVGLDTAEGDQLDLDDPELYVRHHLKSLALWEEPAFSSLALSVIVLWYGLLHYSEYSMLTIVSFMVLFQLTLSAITVNFTPVLRDAKLVSRHFTAERFVEQRRLVPATEIQKLTKGFSMIAGTIMENLEWIMFDTEDMQSLGAFVGVILGVIILNIYYPAYVIFTLAGIGFFTVPALYTFNQGYVDDLVFGQTRPKGFVRNRDLSFSSGDSDVY
mmetsp:Transcript_3314/g.5595  ORF Transcript_3314/g.5595 Transcript_3314/m.5595 type:complete len:304 (+) Transcript_3314:165-1076(+)|eukprot:CAMPEP_0171512620 /NCGR_PEP_ID=MMETSP0959-20130129/1707_1 /TAXON_ID=87120 /ORGANISM="Aurantiochytrium limacinum, Strain ATCCMYA-1381" /LENGTH=303 /DNA_ID=CAMNT_0012050489 /DNA_START=86 /DNA_END=997 /DNA_ORIENTATION=+